MTDPHLLRITGRRPPRHAVGDVVYSPVLGHHAPVCRVWWCRWMIPAGWLVSVPGLEADERCFVATPGASHDYHQISDDTWEYRGTDSL